VQEKKENEIKDTLKSNPLTPELLHRTKTAKITHAKHLKTKAAKKV